MTRLHIYIYIYIYNMYVYKPCTVNPNPNHNWMNVPSLQHTASIAKSKPLSLQYIMKQVEQDKLKVLEKHWQTHCSRFFYYDYACNLFVFSLVLVLYTYTGFWVFTLNETFMRMYHVMQYIIEILDLLLLL